MKRLQELRDLEEGSFEMLGLWAGHIAKQWSGQITHPSREGRKQEEGEDGTGGEEKRDPAPDALLMMAHEASWSRSCVRTPSQASG